MEKVECIKICVKHGAQLDFRTSEENAILPGANALHLACFYGKIHSARAMVSLSGADDPVAAAIATLKNADGTLPENKDTDVKKRGGSAMLLSPTSIGGYTPLHLAVKQGHAGLIRFILNTPEGKESTNITDKSGQLPKQYALKSSNRGILEEFFSNSLGDILEKVLTSDDTSQAACARVMLTNGRSIGCFEYEDIVQCEVFRSSRGQILAQAIMRTASKPLLTAFIDMGASLLQADEAGLPAAFWLKYFAAAANKDPVLPLPASIAENKQIGDMLDRVKKCEQESFQNKFMLGLSQAPSAVVSSANANAGDKKQAAQQQQNSAAADDANLIGSKMKEGFGVTVKPDVLKQLVQVTSDPKESAPSLMGFFDKFKKQGTGKQLPAGPVLDAALWDTRLFLVKMIASCGGTLLATQNSLSQSEERKRIAGNAAQVDVKDDKQLQQLSNSALSPASLALEPVHLATLHLYTGQPSIRNQVEKTLLQWNQNQPWQPFVLALEQAVARLPVIQGVVYRAVDIRFDAKSMAIGNRVKWSTFSSCSQDWQNGADIIRQERGIIFIVQSLSGRVLGKYSSNPVDAEVIFLPGTEFEIVDHYRGQIPALGQANIRKKTYAAKAKDTDKAKLGHACLLIEVRELPASATASTE